MAADRQDGGHLDLPMTRGLSQKKGEESRGRVLGRENRGFTDTIPVNKIAAAVLRIGLFVCIIK